MVYCICLLAGCAPGCLVMAGALFFWCYALDLSSDCMIH
nr:MAG TPA_asm: hypothetical protein [Caudoviricetes sp.]